MSGERYLSIGAMLGGLSGVVTFIGGWIYCMSQYGFLLGFGLGWLPSAMLAALVAAAVTYLWGVAAVLVVIGVIGLMMNSGSTATSDYEVVGAESAADATAEAYSNDAVAAPEPPLPTYSPEPVYVGPYEDAHGAEDCTMDCSGHEAGYAWAEENGIDDVDDCGGNSQSFLEGCEAYVEDNG